MLFKKVLKNKHFPIQKSNILTSFLWSLNDPFLIFYIFKEDVKV